MLRNFLILSPSQKSNETRQSTNVTELLKLGETVSYKAYIS